MKYGSRWLAFGLALFVLFLAAHSARSYVAETTVPAAPGCPAPNHWNASSASPLQLQWTSPLAGFNAIVSVAPSGTSQQIEEIQTVIQQSMNAWTGVAETGVNPDVTPGIVGTITMTNVADSCTNDAGTNVDGVNTICFSQSSEEFTAGVLAFTRVVTANAPGVQVGASATATFAGQILDSGTLFNNTGQVTFATPGALADNPGAYDLESLLTHEFGHYFGLDHLAVRRAILFPFAPPPGTFIGTRPTESAPDGELADDDRTGLRVLYPDLASSNYLGTLRGRIIPANPFALATLAATSPGQPVTGIFGAQVVAEDADTGQIVAATLGGWSCSSANPVAQFDGSYRIDRVPVGHSYKIYAEPLDGLATGEDFYESSNGICAASGTNSCTPPPVNTNFTTRIQPAPQ